MAPWPFTQWGLDIMSSFPTAIRQLKFLVVDIDYFTKWVEAETLATITKKNVRSFVWRNIIYRYIILRVLVSDNGRQFDNAIIQEFLLIIGDQESLLLTRPPSGQWTSWGHKPILAQNHQDSAQGDKGYIVGQAVKCTVGIQDDNQITYRRNTLLTSIRERCRYPHWGRTHKLQGEEPWWEQEQ